MLGSAPCSVQGKRAGVGEAVQHRPATGQLGHRLPVVLLIQKEAGFLPVFKVHSVADAIFNNIHRCKVRNLFTAHGMPALALFHTLQTTDGHVVALIYTHHVLSVGAQHLQQQGEQLLLDEFHAQTQHLRHQHALEPIHRQTGEAVGLSEDHPAAAAILRPHDGLAIVPCVLDAPPPEGLVEPVIGVSGQHPYPDAGAAVEKAAAQPTAPAADDVHQLSVGHGAAESRDLPLIDPWVSAHQSGLPLGGDGDLRIGTLRFHSGHLLSVKVSSLYHSFPPP